MHYVLCNRRFVLGILYFSLCTSQCRQRKGLGAACLWERERATVGHHYAVCLLTSWVLHSERKQEKNQIKKRWKKKGHYGSPLLLSSCVMDWEKRMKTRFLLKPCDWIWKQKHDIYKFCKQNSLRITLGNKTNRKKNLKKGATISDHYQFCLSTVLHPAYCIGKCMKNTFLRSRSFIFTFWKFSPTSKQVGKVGTWENIWQKVLWMKILCSSRVSPSRTEHKAQAQAQHDRVTNFMRIFFG